MTLLATVVPLAIMFCGCLAWDGFRRYLDEAHATRVADTVLAELSARLDEHERVQKMLAQDWMKRFNQLEADWKTLQEHANSQYAGNLEAMRGQSRFR